MEIIPEDLAGLGGELPPLPGITLPGGTRLTRRRRILRTVASFFVGQGAAQGVSVLAALFLLHHLSFVAYAQFSLATAFQSVFVTLMDLGFTGTIIPMVGERRDDRALLGRHLRAAKHLRDRAFWVLAPFAAATLLAVMHKQHWDWRVQLLLVASVLLALYSGGRAAYYAAPLLLFSRLRDYYFPQVITATCRLAAYVGLGIAGALNAWAAAALGALNITANGIWLRRNSQSLFLWPDREDPAIERELLRYALPAAPAIIFSAFQSQVTLVLISIFGGATIYIAQVAALSRIAQLFSVLMTFNIVVVEPYIARLNRQRLSPTFIALILLASLGCVPIVFVAFLKPGIFLWLIGSKYSDLSNLVGWLILSACMNYVAGLMWIMNRARKWVFWSGSILEVGLILLVQSVFVIVLGVRNTRQAVFLSFSTSFCYLIAHGYVSVYGFFNGPRRTHVTSP